jgi:gluconolactonase
MTINHLHDLSTVALMGASEITLMASGFRTIEGPTIDAAGDLYFSDVRGGGVYRLAPDGQVDVVVPKRKGVGGICLHAQGGIVVSGRDLSHVKDGGSRVIFSRADVEPVEGLTVGGFNDIGSDPEGRIFAGAQRMTSAGAFGDGDVILVTGEHAGVSLFHGAVPNGNAVAPDGSALYQTDSAGRRLLVFDLNGSERPPMSRTISTASHQGAPDGIAVDENGMIWIAFRGTDTVACLSPTGEVLERVALPTPSPTSVCFGPPSSHLLYVVTDDAEDDFELGACIFRVDVEVDGAPVHQARV